MTEPAADIPAEPDWARRHAVNMVTDLSWLIGAAQGAGIDVPTRITDDLLAAVNWLATS